MGWDGWGGGGRWRTEVRSANRRGKDVIEGRWDGFGKDQNHTGRAW